MIAFLARVGRAALITVAVAAGVVAVGLLDNPRASLWLIVGLAVIAALAGLWWYLAGELHRAPLVRRQAGGITVPGGRLAAEFSWDSRGLEHVVVSPNDGRPPLYLEAVSMLAWGDLVHAKTPAALRVRARQLGGVR